MPTPAIAAVITAASDADHTRPVSRPPSPPNHVFTSPGSPHALKPGTATPVDQLSHPIQTKDTLEAKRASKSPERNASAAATPMQQTAGAGTDSLYAGLEKGSLTVRFSPLFFSLCFLSGLLYMIVYNTDLFNESIILTKSCEGH